jgi:23S rRNA (adenine2030-N6)-methyltransferase
LNYRHAFHAGNFADLVKHVAVLAGLEALLASKPACTVIDTHAGAGVYDLIDPMAVRSGEAAVAIGALMALAHPPAVFAPLIGCIRALNPDGRLRYYPGSPSLMAQSLRAQDQYWACELRADDFALLQQTLARTPARCVAQQTDGYSLVRQRTPASGPVLVLIDPPFERADDYQNAAEAALAVMAKNPTACVMIWTPLKDMETLDGFLRRLEQGHLPATLVAETRLRPLTQPMRLNGCAMVVLNPPQGLAAGLQAAGDWVVSALGDPGAEGRIWALA